MLPVSENAKIAKDFSTRWSLIDFIISDGLKWWLFSSCQGVKMLALISASESQTQVCPWKRRNRKVREDADNLFRTQHLSPRRFWLDFIPILPSIWLNSNETWIFTCFPSHSLALQCWSTGSPRSWQEVGEKWTHTGVKMITTQVAAQYCQYSDTLYTIFCSLNIGSLLTCKW